MNDKNQIQNKNKLPASETLDPCVHCGFCLPSCASYRVLGTEMDSPRGRIHILKAIEKGEVKLDASIASHFDTCLGCFACVTACPSGVRYDQLIEETRPLLNEPGLRSQCENIFRNILLLLLPYPKRLRTILQILRGYAGSPLQSLAREMRLTKLFGPQLEAMESLLPKLPKESFQDDFQIINKAKGQRRGRVGLVLGCVQRCFDPKVNEATVAVLQANGWEVVIPRSQGCCGAIAHHQGEIDLAKKLAIELTRSFESTNESKIKKDNKPIDAILIAASGCGHTMKAFESITQGEARFSAPVLDVHEFLIKKGLSKNFIQSLKPLMRPNGNCSTKQNPMKIVYHDACHMIHGQRIYKEPRELLQSIPHIQLKEAIEAGTCCGSAGIYNLVKPKEAAELGQIKGNDLCNTGAEIVLSANIGCSLQIRQYINDGLEVTHPMQLLAKSAGLH